MTQTDSGISALPSAGVRVGYVRVSTIAQTLDQQNAALAAAGVTKVFSDTMSGAKDDRAGLAALMDYVREGDTVVVWKLDRLGRNTLHILETVRALTDRGVTLISTTDGIDSSTAAGRMVIGVLASMAEFERELIKERTALKRAMSLANGTKFGRRKKVGDPSHITTAKRMKDDGEADEGRRQIPGRQSGHAVPVFVGRGCGVKIMTPPHRFQYYILPDDPLRAVNILRAAAGLDPLRGANDYVQLDDVGEECSPA